MKPIEENWTTGKCKNPDHTQDSSCYSVRYDGKPIQWTPERIKLAAQAPRMARLLQAWLRHDEVPTFSEAISVLRDAGVDF